MVIKGKSLFPVVKRLYFQAIAVAADPNGAIKIGAEKPDSSILKTLKHLGLSTHQNARRVLAAASETGEYDLAQVAMTTAGWYD